MSKKSISKNRTKSSSKNDDKPSKPSTGSVSSGKVSMKTAEIRDLIDFISKTGLNEVNIETSELKLHVKREPDQKIFKSSPIPVAAPVAAQVSTSVPANAPVAQKSDKTSESASANKTLEIRSPMIGTFYRSGNPDTPAFVSVGDKVIKGQPVCIIEAMKLFNEIESEVSGTIIKVAVENASPVEYDQVLFVVEPD
jgi:acetyl-CoA carboxylase biotin carboxyl carrier protein